MGEEKVKADEVKHANPFYVLKLLKKTKEEAERMVELLNPFLKDISGLGILKKPRIRVGPLSFFAELSPFLKTLVSSPRGQYIRRKNIVFLSNWKDMELVMPHELMHAVDYQHGLDERVKGEMKSKGVYSKSELKRLLPILREGRAMVAGFMYKFGDRAFEELERFVEKEVDANTLQIKLSVQSIFVSLSVYGASTGFNMLSGSLSHKLFGVLLTGASLLALSSLAKQVMITWFELRLERLIRAGKAFDPYTTGTRFMLEVAKRIGGLKNALKLTFEKPPVSLDEILRPEVYVSRVMKELKE